MIKIMNASYGQGIYLSYFDNLHDGEKSDYYEGSMPDLGITATGSSWAEALTNVLNAASQSSFNSTY